MTFSVQERDVYSTRAAAILAVLASGLLIMQGCLPDDDTPSEPANMAADAGMEPAQGESAEEDSDAGVEAADEDGEERGGQDDGDGEGDDGDGEGDAGAGDEMATCYERCLEAGRNDEDCRRRCAGDREEQEEGDDCAEGCREQARAAYDRCIGNNPGEEEACRERAGAAARACAEMACGEREDEVGEDEGNPDDPDACAQGCRERARAVYDQCIASGRFGDDEAPCRERAGAAARACQEMACGEREDEGGPDEPDDCAEGCRERSRVVYDECVAGGGDEAACRERAGAAARQCVERACGEREDEGGPDEPDDCAQGCRERARAAYNQCIENSPGQEDACRERAGAAARACQEMACGEREDEGGPDEPDDCAQRCRERARAAYNQCIESNPDQEEACRERAGAAERACQEMACGDREEDDGRDGDEDGPERRPEQP